MACYVCKRFMSSVGMDSNGLQSTKKYWFYWIF